MAEWREIQESLFISITITLLHPLSSKKLCAEKEFIHQNYGELSAKTPPLPVW